jgi:transposase
MGTTATGRPRNRSCPGALKREIVAASFAPGSSVSMVARQHDVNANQVFNWRKLYRDDPRAPAVTSAPQLIPVIVTAGPDAVATQPPTVAEAIEIDFAGKYRVRVGSGVEALVVPLFLLAHFRRGNLEPQLPLGLKMGLLARINGILAASARSR